MINLDKHYGTISPFELIEIIESIDKYKPEVIDYCKARVNKMKIKKEILKSHATKVLKQRFYQYFQEGKYLTERPIVLDSFFLDPEDVKLCFEESKIEFKTHIEAMTTNVNTA
jgi:hypothetical protein